RRASRREGDTAVELRNPFRLKWVLGFALLFAVVQLLAAAATQALGPVGTYGAAALAGLTDVNAITLSVAQLADRGEVSRQVATNSIVLGAAANTVSKAVIAVGLGGWEFASRVVLALLGVLVAGAAGLALAGVV
ncbi:MAG: DUF4010 domain-containing protein, partial [Myxococcaceae bacterium]|nr:DUF4010 domain-containing protein [Myxococcaceae bacterium]